MMIEIRAEYPHAGAYISGYKILSPSRQYVDMNIPGIPETQQSGIMPSYFQSAASGAFPVRSSNVMIPKDVFNAVGKFPVGEWWGEDSDMWGRIALKFSIAYHVKTCSIYHEDVVDRTCNIIQEVVEHPFIATANDALSANTVPDCIIQDLLEYMAREQLQTAGRNLQAGRPDLARKNVQNCRTKGLIREKYWVLLWTFVPPKVFMALKRWKSEISQKLQKRTSFDSASSDIA
jgi:hypothetical protein